MTSIPDEVTDLVADTLRGNGGRGLVVDNSMAADGMLVLISPRAGRAVAVGRSKRPNGILLSLLAADTGPSGATARNWKPRTTLLREHPGAARATICSWLHDGCAETHPLTGAGLAANTRALLRAAATSLTRGLLAPLNPTRR